MTPPDLPRIYRIAQIGFDASSDLGQVPYTEMVTLADHAGCCAALHQQIDELKAIAGDAAYRAGEWETINALLSDRDEIGLYAKVEALLKEQL